MSAWIQSTQGTSEDRLMLAVVIDRGHGVASLTDGELEVMQHRRGAPYVEDAAAEAIDGEMPIVLDDVDRIFTETWLAIGNLSVANTLRIAMKRRLNHPLSISFGSGAAAAAAGGSGSADSARALAASLPPALTMQTLRANNANGTELILRIAHNFALGSAATPASMAMPQTLNLQELLQSARIPHQIVQEVTLTGLAAKQSVSRQMWEANGTVLPEGAWSPAVSETGHIAPADVAAIGGAVVTIRALEIRAWLLRIQK